MTKNEMTKQDALISEEEVNTEDERKFTQQDVNRFIRDRLQRNKQDYERSLTEEREKYAAELSRLEAEYAEKEIRLSCQSYVISNDYPEELLEIIDTTNFEEFKKKADMAQSLIRQNKTLPPLRSTEDNNFDGGLSKAFEKKGYEPKIRSF